MNLPTNLVTDRTWADVEYANALHRRIAANGFASLTPAERAAWLVGLKGTYMYSDWNRVESTVRFLADLLGEHGYRANVSTFAEWGMSDTPTKADMQRYLGNVRRLIDAFTVLPTTPEPPDTMTHLTHGDANAIEQILQDIYTAIQNMPTGFRYSGENYTGE